MGDKVIRSGTDDGVTVAVRLESHFGTGHIVAQPMDVTFTHNPQSNVSKRFRVVSWRHSKLVFLLLFSFIESIFEAHRKHCTPLSHTPSLVEDRSHSCLPVLSPHGARNSSSIERRK